MSLGWADSRWLFPAIGALLLIAAAVAWQYARASRLPPWARWCAGTLKVLGFAALLLVLPDPQIIRQQTRPGANAVAILVDNSASMGIADQDGGRRRGDLVADWLATGDWQQKLAAEVRVRRYLFDRALHRSDSLAGLNFDGSETALGSALERLQRAPGSEPLAGIVVFTDGAATDAGTNLPEHLPPVFPVLIAPHADAADASIERATATTTVFESAPVTIDAVVRCTGAAGRGMDVNLLDASGSLVKTERVVPSADDETVAVRFLATPEKPGPAAYRVEAALEGDHIPQNNAWHVVANRDAGPFRVLYIAGTPNWEHKFLRRALDQDQDIRLSSLVRIARGEAQMGWNTGDSSHPFYQGQKPADEVERYDEPIYMRLGGDAAERLQGGFPSNEADLFVFDAVILDNIEAGAFTHDQLALLRKYVSERGGSLAMLGGIGSLDAGDYAKTVVADLLPVYLGSQSPAAPGLPVRLEWTREGMLQPWLRLRATEEAEQDRLRAMPEFRVAHGLDSLKPGAQVLATLIDADGTPHPAIATQRFGNGRCTAILVGDLWRWGLRDTDSRADLDKFWRQAVRGWMADVPRRAAMEIRRTDKGRTEILITANGPDFRPSRNASVQMRLRSPSGEWRDLHAQPAPDSPGRFTATVAPSISGAWTAEAVVTDPADGEVTRLESGFAINAEAAEFRTVTNARAAMNAIAEATGGRVLTPDELSGLPGLLRQSPRMLTNSRSTPLWHHAAWLAVAIGCFIGEWGIRRWRGLA